MHPILRRLGGRKLVQWALAYLAGAWLVIEVMDTVGDSWGLSDGLFRAIQFVLAFGLLVALVLAWYHGEKGRQRTIAAGLDAAQIAFALDTTLLAARTALALFRYQSFDWTGAEAELERVLETDPSSSSALVRHAEVLTATGQMERAVAQIRSARRVDGLSATVRQIAARVLASSGRPDEAIREAQEALRLSRDDRGVWTDIGFLFLTAGRFDDARNAFQTVAELTSVDPAGVDDFVTRAEDYLAAGVSGQLPVGVEGLSEGRAGTAALYHASVGDVEGALALLEAAVEAREYDLATLVSLPTLDPLRDLPPFRGLLVRMGLGG